MARNSTEINTSDLLRTLDARHEELLRDLEDLNLQIEQALTQLRVGDAQSAPMPAPAMSAAASKPSRANRPARPARVGK